MDKNHSKGSDKRTWPLYLIKNWDRHLYILIIPVLCFYYQLLTLSYVSVHLLNFQIILKLKNLNKNVPKNFRLMNKEQLTVNKKLLNLNSNYTNLYYDVRERIFLKRLNNYS
ncbi:hypothetical protein BpHYR1_045997 [Brachionus plicatilis]|uniref:Uncharacterized protein n=1 Tax=Brachionus plicatilis TaxID=10195 RepID=A0A3M7SI68_BRAPC|nr:hypothetical protein BpHYR1_045997 [Brachionus plicatilis]